MVQWRPGASLDVLKLRARLLSEVREFFCQRQVMEVETPLLASATVSDVHLQSLHLQAGPTTEQLYLQTSPEFAMKRLLGAGSGPIYQICKAFRAGEMSRRHNPEFTMLEWYRPGFQLEHLMDEVESLVTSLLELPSIPRFSYREVFERHLDIDPHRADLETLAALARQHIELTASNLDATDFLQLLMTHCIEPELPEACFIFDYPQAQAALAVVAADGIGQPVARRFELYLKGMELANGYFELTDAAEQRRRFEADLEQRRQRGLPEVPVDERLLAALENGLPDCAGVALGFDRLVMAVAGLTDIDASLAFSAARA